MLPSIGARILKRRLILFTIIHIVFIVILLVECSSSHVFYFLKELGLLEWLEHVLLVFGRIGTIEIEVDVLGFILVADISIGNRSLEMGIVLQAEAVLDATTIAIQVEEEEILQSFFHS